MVRTGKRTDVLYDVLTASGLKRLAKDVVPGRPGVTDLADDVRDELLDLYRGLGGTQVEPTLRPGPWDLVFEGPLVVELDEELHFNRYRAATLTASWEQSLPWNASYRRHCLEHEIECLAAGAWGKRWTNESAGRMFCGGAAGDLEGAGAPRWKQRALYDAIKDTLATFERRARLARVATHDRVCGVLLGEMLDGLVPVDVVGIRALVDGRAG